MMRASTLATALALVSTLAFHAASATQPTTRIATQDHIVPIGGLTVIPDAFRYRPKSVGISAGPQLTHLTESTYLGSTLSRAYVSDRESLLNTIRARRGLSLLTFWENSARCLFFGLNHRGEPGLNLVSVRRLERQRWSQPSETAQLYAHLTGQVRPTFPVPPSVLDR
ncbi:MAG: hypothetical protein AAF270_00710 [Pseudomonadota bacterium]